MLFRGLFPFQLRCLQLRTPPLPIAIWTRARNPLFQPGARRHLATWCHPDEQLTGLRTRRYRSGNVELVPRPDEKLTWVHGVARCSDGWGDGGGCEAAEEGVSILCCFAGAGAERENLFRSPKLLFIARLTTILLPEYEAQRICHPFRDPMLLPSSYHLS